MQCKDIPDRPILELLAARSPEKTELSKNTSGQSIEDVVSESVPKRLLLAKMRQLIRRGLVDGCSRGGCGDFAITEQGRQEVRRQIAAEVDMGAAGVDTLVRVSPNLTCEMLETGRVEDLARVFEDRMRGWVIEPARRLLESAHDDPISAVLLACAYFEPLGHCSNEAPEKMRHAAAFKRGVEVVFENASAEQIPMVADVLWRDLRCGFFHYGCALERVYFWNQVKGAYQLIYIRLNEPDEHGRTTKLDSIVINPARFLGVLARHLETFMRGLLDPTNVKLRERFEVGFKRMNAVDGKPRRVHWTPETLLSHPPP